MNLAGGSYRLASTSPYKSAGTDGKDIGADFDALTAAMGGAIQPPPRSPLAYRLPIVRSLEWSTSPCLRRTIWG